MGGTPFMLVIIDCGMGNLQSVVRAFERIGATPHVSALADDVAAAERIVLPGVGSLAHGMDTLRRHGLLPVLAHKVCAQRTPVLGICVGHQMLATRSEEGDAPGLGWIEGAVTRFHFDGARPLKVPHLGWNTLRTRPGCPLFDGIPEDACFYFAHSYKLESAAPESIAATTAYGVDFVSAVHRDNIFGTQFHPEKSQRLGLALIANFLKWAP